jgi:serum response factor
VLQAYELSTLTGTQVMLLVASETGHVYTFATRYSTYIFIFLSF